MYSNLLLPHIASPTRVTLNSETLIDNIFSNNDDSSFTSGNLVTTLSDHHAQFLLMEFQNKQMDNKKIQIFRDFSKIENNKKLINTHLEGIDWATELQVNRNNADLSSELFLKKIEQLINFWAPKGSKEINNPSKIANNFNNHFTSIAEKIEDNLVKSKFNYSKYLSNPNEYSFFMKPTNAEEVLCEITKLKNNKSIGPCSIPLKFLKLFKTTLSEPISLKANIPFSTGTFPSTLKTANVTPIYKKEDHTLCNNYRPISLLSNISKIIEKLVHIRLTKFLNK